VTLKAVLGNTEGHWKWHYSIYRAADVWIEIYCGIARFPCDSMAHVRNYCERNSIYWIDLYTTGKACLRRAVNSASLQRLCSNKLPLLALNHLTIMHVCVCLPLFSVTGLCKLISVERMPTYPVKMTEFLVTLTLVSFLARGSNSTMLSAIMLSPVRLSVCHTGRSYTNGSS